MKKPAPPAAAPSNAGAVGIIPPPFSPNNPQLPPVPDHELLRRIGGGSYGEVWLARNVMGTLRAVKIIRRQTFDRDEHFEREFKGIQKFEPVSRSHEGLVDILQVGRNNAEGYFYYVMELADQAEGSPQSTSANPQLYFPRTLASDLKARGLLPLCDCVSTGLALTAALEHLHKAGLVHRDIKPSNIIFVNGSPKLADIGLVTEVSEAKSLVGTVGYIAPEGPGSAQADLYSLGKVLYEISTGKDRQDFPALPQEFRENLGTARAPRAESGAWPDSSGDSTREARAGLFERVFGVSTKTTYEARMVSFTEFNEVLLKACESDPRHRYASAQGMHDELGLLQRGQSLVRKHARQQRFDLAKKLSLPVLLMMFLAALTWVSVLKPRKAPNTEAVRLYNLGRDYSRQLTDEDLKKSVDYLNQAIQADPEFVPAYVTLFEVSTSVLVDGSAEKRFELQKHCARKLMTLAPNLGESHAALSWVKAGTNDWVGAEAEIKRAIQLNPNYAVAYAMYGCYMTWWLGRVDEAPAMLRKAQELDPTSPMHATVAGFPSYAKRRFPEAIAQFRKALELSPNCGWTRMWIGKAYEAGGDYLAAIAEFEALDLRPGADKAKVKEQYRALKKAFAESGAPGYWQTVLEFYQESQVKGLLEFDRYSLAGLYARLGQKERALTQLEMEAATGDWDSWLNFEPFYDSLRQEPRFKAVLKLVGLEK